MACVLCDGIRDNFVNIQQHYANLTKKIMLFETENFKVIPDKFPISPNHIIILPKKHINTFAEFNEVQAEEVGKILDFLQLKTESKSFIMFEHGTSKSEELNTDPSIKSIFHAHLHFIPDVKCTTQDIADFFANKSVRLLDTDNKEKDIFSYESQYLANRNLVPFLRDSVIYENETKTSIESYLYIKNSDNTHLFFPERLVTPRIPSQFLREALSVVCDTPEWNWKIPMTKEGRAKYEYRIKKMTELFETESIEQPRKILGSQIPAIRNVYSNMDRMGR